MPNNSHFSLFFVLHRTIIRALSGAVLLSAVSFGVGANGWEHTAVPLTALVGALDDDNPEFRQRAASSLGYRHEQAAVDALLTHVSGGEPIARVRQAVYGALGGIGDLRGFDAIADCVQDESQAAVRGACITALGGLAGKPSEDLLIELLDSDLAGERTRAIYALGNFSSDRAVNALGDQINPAAANQTLLRGAVSALGQTGNRAAASYLTPLLDLKTPTPLLVDTLMAISLVGDSALEETLRQIYQRTAEANVRAVALYALSAVAADGGTGFAVEALGNDDRGMQLQALTILKQQAIQHRGSQRQSLAGEVVRTVVDRCLGQAKPLFENPDSPVADDQALLTKLIDIEVLYACLQTVVALDPRYGFDLFRLAASSVDIKLDRPVMLELAEGYYRSRWQALYGVGYTFNPGAEPILREALGDGDFRIRSVALRSIGVYGAKSFADEVIAAINDTAAEVRWTAAQVLGRKPGFPAGQALQRLLSDPHAVVRREAALSAGYAGVSDATKKLTAMHDNDKDESVRQAAALSLSLLAER